MTVSDANDPHVLNLREKGIEVKTVPNIVRFTGDGSLGMQYDHNTFEIVSEGITVFSRR